MVRRKKKHSSLRPSALRQQSRGRGGYWTHTRHHSPLPRTRGRGEMRRVCAPSPPTTTASLALRRRSSGALLLYPLRLSLNDTPTPETGLGYPFPVSDPLCYRGLCLHQPLSGVDRSRRSHMFPHPPNPPPPQAGEGGILAHVCPIPPTTTALLAQSQRS